MARRILLTALVALCLPLVTHSATWEGSYTVGSADNTETPAESVAFVNSTGLYTSPTELDRFKALADAAGTDQYDTDLASLLGSSHAGGVDTDSEWETQHTISAEEYLGDESTCRPSSVAWNAGNVENYDLTEIASSLYSLALAGSIEDDESYFTEAHNHLLELTETSFDLTFDPDLSIQNPGSDQCGLDMATAIPWIAETAMLLEQESFAAWSYADRLQLATWMAEEVFPLVHWTTQRKNNWGPAGLSGALAIAWYVDGPITSIVRFDGASITPASYYGTGIGNDINRWISNSTPNELDSATSSLSCAFNGQVFGIQPTGTVPDDVRRSTDFNDCDEPDLEFAGCLSGGGPYTSGCGGFSGAVFYQQKSTQLLTRTFEALRRIDGNGDRGYELAYREHGGANEVLYDMILASTTLTTGSDGDFQDIWTTDTTQGYRWMAGQYYGLNKAGVNSCITGLLDDGSVFIEGGNDVPYSRITHADGVAYTTTPGECVELSETFVAMASSTLASDPDLTARVPTVYDPGQVVTTDWTYYDATCKCNDGACASPVDADAASCSAVTGIVDESGSTHTVVPLPSSFTYGPVPNDGVSEAAAIHRNLLLTDLDDDELLVFPDGEYIYNSGFDGIYFWRPDINSDHRGFIGESRDGTIFTLEVGSHTGANEYRFYWIEGEGQVLGTSDGLAQTTWTSGFTAGTDTIGVTSSSGFSAGQYVRLDAAPGGTQGDGAGVWHTTIERIPDGTSIELTRPLPETFGSSSATVRQWTPAEEIVLRNFTVRVPDVFALHQSTASSAIVTRGTAHFEATNILLDNFYQNPILLTQGMDPRFERVDVTDPYWDKGPGGYGVVTQQVSGGVYYNSRIQHVTGVAFGSGTQNMAFVGNDLPGPPRACVDIYSVPSTGGGTQTSGSQDGYCDSDGSTRAFDWVCDGNFGDGGGDDCFTAEADHTYHGAIYSAANMNAGCTASEDPYPCCTGSGTGTCTGTFLHCINDYGDTPSEAITEVQDAKGWNGSASCHGVKPGAIYSCAEWHNFAGNGIVFARNSCGGPIWFDDAEGPGNRHFIFGNELVVGVADEFGANPGDRGDFFFRSVGQSIPAGYKNDAIWSNNVIVGDFSSGPYGYNAFGDGVAVTDNVIGGDCQYHSDVAITDPELSTLCASRTTDADADFAVNDIWAWNCIGGSEHDGAGCAYQSTETGGYSRTMPSLPFGSDWPFDFNQADTPAPFVGPDAPAGSCLPAKHRLDGSC